MTLCPRAFFACTRLENVSLIGIMPWRLLVMLILFTGCAHTRYTRQVDGQVKSKKSGYQLCFDQIYAEASVGMTDGLRMEWIIVPTGEATQIRFVAQTPLGNKLGVCISKIVGTIHFVAPDQPTLVRYPFVFTKRKPDVDLNY